MISDHTPAPIKSPIFGPAYVGRSSNLVDEQCINLYPDLVEVGTGRALGALYSAPGLVKQYSVGSGPVRGLHTFNGTLYAVTGTDLYSIASDGTTTRLTSDSSNISGVGGYSYSSASSFARIRLPFAPVNTGTYVTMTDNGTQLAVFVGMSVTQQDGFCLVNQPRTFKFFQSAIDDLTSWPALNFAEASGDPDHIIRLIQIRREIFVIKQTKTEIWNNAGTSGFVFAREQGPYIEAGCAAPASACRSGETIFWLARNDQGDGVVVKLVGYELQRISTHYVEREIQTWPTISDAVGYAYQQEGHTFYVLTSPSGGQTFVYDDTVSTIAQRPMWTQRNLYSSVGFLPHPGNCYAFFNNMNLIGSNVDGTIYSYDLNSFDDAGATRVWLRTWRATPQNVGRVQKFNLLVLDLQTGVQVPDGLEPKLMLRWSDDGGHTWVQSRIASMGKTGETSYRVMFTRLGALKAETGFDRIFELSGSDPVPIAIIGAELN